MTCYAEAAEGGIFYYLMETRVKPEGDMENQELK